jgi:GH25 family lysozyme M1 (1,4-beta-N-acetylmuramidase)
MTDITLADISEFQTSIDADAYIAGGHRALICRVHNGYRADHMMPARGVYLRGKPFEALGWYQYLASGRDAATQAREFCATVGALRQNEFAVLDLEEGPGDQIPRAEAWFAVVDQWAGFQASLYSGASFLRTQLGGPARWGQRPLWIASYPGSYQPVPALEPAGADWWQYTDRARFPGLAGGVDGSIYHGTATQFLQVVRLGAAPPEPPPFQPFYIYIGDEMIAVAQNKDGRLELFVEKSSTGEIVHKWQVEPNGKWTDKWASMGKP